MRHQQGAALIGRLPSARRRLAEVLASLSGGPSRPPWVNGRCRGFSGVCCPAEPAGVSRSGAPRGTARRGCPAWEGDFSLGRLAVPA
jgi:hypothetical protein